MEKKNPMPEKVLDRPKRTYEEIFFFSKKKKYYYDTTARKNKYDIWEYSVSKFSGGHFATFPEKMIEEIVRTASPEKGLILDPFLGAGTTALVSLKNNRYFLGIEINPRYIEIAKERIKPYIGIKRLDEYGEKKKVV